MKTTLEYRDYVVDSLSVLDNIVCKPMMGEYLLYYDGTLFGGIYNNRLLIKKTMANEKYHLPEALPYEGAKMMWQIEALEDQEFLKEIVEVTSKDLPKKK